MRWKNIELFPLFFATLLLLFSIFFYFETVKWKNISQELTSENAELNASLMHTEESLANETARANSLGSELESTKHTLDETGNSLNTCKSDLADETEQLGICLSRNEELAVFLTETKDELENLSGELGQFQMQIESAMSWFTENSNMDNLSASLRYQVDKCTSNTEINAPCIPIVMKEEKGWAYQVEEGDTLLSLEEMVRKKGGDCEDWSLYFKAAYNYLKEEDRPERYLVSAVPGTGNFQIYGDHYYIDAEGREIGTTKDNIYIICYDSHCIVAMSDVEIQNSSDLYKLTGAPAIEPQNGQFMFTVGSLLAPSICSDEGCDYSDIWLIITDDDIYDFHYGWQWISYKDYHDAAGYYKSRVDAMISLVEETGI